MKRHVIALVSGIVLLLASVVFVSCVPQSSAATQPTDSIAYKSDVAAVNARVDTQAQRIDAVAGKAGISQSEVQTLINNALKDYAKTSDVTSAVQALKTDQSWITGTTHTTPAGTISGDYGELLDTNGDLELWLEKVSGEVSDVFITRNGTSAEGRFDLVVVNKDAASSHDFSISLTLSPDADVDLGAVPSSVAPVNKVEIDGGLVFSLTRTGVARNPVLAFQTNNGRIVKGDVQDYTIWLTLTQISSSTSPVEWDYSFNIKDRD